MRNKTLSRVFTGLILGWGFSQAALASGVSETFATPSIDRWMYVFNQTPGTETEARVFSPFPYEFGFFDNRDGQFFVAWDTGNSQIPIGRPLNHYRVARAMVKVRVSGNNYFQYDPTYDSYLSYPPSPPLSPPAGAVADADVGRPVEMFVCGFRSNYVLGPAAPVGSQVFTQTSPYAAGPAFPSVDKRLVFPGQYDSSGALIDVSNNVDDQFEARPIAVGRTQVNADQPAVVAPGDAVPLNTDMVFTIDLTQPEALDAIRQGLSQGRVGFMITSLALTTQGSSIVPRFYTRQWVIQNGPDAAAKPASLELDVCVAPPTDWNCSGLIEVQDIFDFLNDWFAGRGDFDGNGTVSIQDIFDFLNAWFVG